MTWKYDMLNKRLWLALPLGLCACLLMASCGSGEESVAAPPTESVTLIVGVPATEGTRAVDPGENPEEGEDWDKMAVIVAYTQTTTEHPQVVKHFISKSDFEALPLYNDNSDYRLLTLNLWQGQVHIYGVTYSEDVTGNPEERIDDCATDAAVQALTISNNYAEGSENVAAKFLSVATGYYSNNNGDIANYNIGSDADYGPLAPIPSMRLARLAAKIDIQWDAKDAYDEGYTDVKVTDFTYYNHKDGEGNDVGYGQLFPSLLKADSEDVDGHKTFYNTSAISQRNGRVYHYAFPDGRSTPKVEFNITATNGENATTQQTYSLVFPESLRQSAWYKVNATIRGVSGSGEVNIDLDN